MTGTPAPDSAQYLAQTTILRLFRSTTGSGGDEAQVVISNRSASNQPVYLGGPTLTASNGWELPAGRDLTYTVPKGWNMYVIADAGDVPVHVLVLRGPLDIGTDTSAAVPGTDYSSIADIDT